MKRILRKKQTSIGICNTGCIGVSVILKVKSEKLKVILEKSENFPMPNNFLLKIVLVLKFNFYNLTFPIS